MVKLVPIDGDPFAAGAGGKLVPVDHDPFAVDGSEQRVVDGVPVNATPGAEMRAYEPTIRERLASWLMGDNRASPEKQRLVKGLLGTTGTGEVGISVSDFTPARIPMLAQEAVRAAEAGDVTGTVLNTIGALPVPVVNAGINAVASRRAAKVAEKLADASAAERIGVALPRGVDSGLPATVAKNASLPVVGNPLENAGNVALRQLAEKGNELGKAAGKPMSGVTALRDWLLGNGTDVSQAVAKADDLVPAPAVARAADAAPAPTSGLDEPFRIITPDQGMEIAAKPQIVELDDLKFASGALQPRDRGRLEYTTEMLERAARLDPAQLRPSRVSDSGAPIVLPDGTILSGNGRARSIAQVYADSSLAERAAAYKASLGPEAANMKRPVMVMRADGLTADDAAKFADLSNRSRIATMSATERASRDASALGPDGVSLYRGGDFEAPQNEAFLRHFMGKVATAGERNALSKEGRLTQEGVQRMRNSVIAAAYDDAATLSKMLESSDDNIRNLTGALADAAPRIAALKADIKAGVVLPDLDAAPQITAAVRKIADLRNQGVTAERWLAQMDAFDDTDPLVKSWVVAFHSDDLSRPASRKRMTEVLEAYADEARKHAPGGLFDDPTTARDVLNVARRSGDESARAAGSAGADIGEQVARNGAGNAERGSEAGRQAADAGGGATVQGRGSLGDGAAGQAGITSPGQVGHVKSPAEIILETNKRRLGAALGLGDNIVPSAAFARIEEMVRSGTAGDVASLMKAKALVGEEAWDGVSKAVLHKLGLGNDLVSFADNWKSMPENGKRALLGSSPLKSDLDDFVTVLGKVEPLKGLTRTVVGTVRANLDGVPVIGPILANKITGPLVQGGAVMTEPTTAAVIGSGYAVAKYLSRPRSVKNLTRWLRAYEGLRDNSKAASAVLSLASRTLAKDLSDETGGDEVEIARALDSVKEAR